jgi:hypothetical protein
MSIFSWKISEEEMKTQVENYNNLKITQSYRGISALLILGSMVLTVLLAKFGVISYDAIYSSIIYLPIAFFIWKGHRWAMIAMMILWTFEKGYQLYASGGTSPIVPIIWWAIFMGYFVNAFKIELARKKLTTVTAK